MRLSVSFFLNVFFTFNLSFCFAQLTGKIVDESNIPLEYATAALYNQEDQKLVTGVVSDLNGVFRFKNLKRGTYYLEISFMGYESKTLRDLKISNTKTIKDLGTVQLTLGNKLNEVVINSSRAAVINKIDKQIFNTNNFKNAQGGTGVDVLKNLPSVSVNAQGELSVRGSTGFVVLINGRPTQSDPGALISQLPANAIERVELITAPSAKYDPEGKAGIINIITQKGAVDGSFGQLNLRGGFPSIERYGNENIHQRYGADATYNVQKEKWNISIGVSYQRNDLGGRREGDVFTVINDTLTRFPSSGERSFDEKNYNARFTLDYTPDSSNVFSAGFYAGKRSKVRLADIVYFDNNAVTPADSDNRLYTFQYFNHNVRERKSDFILGSFDYAHTFNNNSQLKTSFLYEYTLLGGPTVNQNLGFPDTSILYQDEFNTNDNPLNGIRFQADYIFKPFSIGQLQTGYQFRSLDHTGDFIYERRTDFNAPFVLVPEFSSKVDLKRIIHSVYGQLTGTKKKWGYSAGARLELMDRDLNLQDRTNTIDTTYTYDFVKIYPSATLSYAFDETTTAKVSYSKRVERTTTFKMNPFPEREHSETLEQGDPTLRPEFIDLIEIGLDKRLGKGNSVFATAYYRNTSNLVNRVNTVYNDTILNRIYSNVGNGRALGLEAGASFNSGENWSNFLGANVYKYKIDGSFDERPLNTNTTVFSINLNSTYNFWKNASVQFTFNYLSDRITAQGEDSRFYSPNLTLSKAFLNKSLTATLQWQNIDLGLLNTNEQRITTFRPDDFFTTTNYIYEVDMVTLNLTYIFKDGKNKSKFIESEFGQREF